MEEKKIEKWFEILAEKEKISSLENLYSYLLELLSDCDECNIDVNKDRITYDLIYKFYMKTYINFECLDNLIMHTNELIIITDKVYKIKPKNLYSNIWDEEDLNSNKDYIDFKDVTLDLKKIKYVIIKKYFSSFKDSYTYKVIINE